MQLFIDEKALKNLRKIPFPYREKINERILNLPNAPYPKDVKKLMGNSNLFRVRVNNFRVIYSIQRDCIYVTKVSHRKDAYR